MVRSTVRSEGFRLVAGSLLLAVIVWEALSVLYPGRAVSIPLWYCNLSNGPCHTVFPGRMSLDITPRPIVPGDVHSISFASSDSSIERVEVELSSVDLDMGTATAELKRRGDAFVGEAQIPVCVHSTLKWRALLTVHARGSVQRISFYWKNRREKRPPN